MPPLIKFANPIWFLTKQTKIGQIRGVDIFVHWTVFLVAAVILSGVLRHPALTILGLGGLLGSAADP